MRWKGATPFECEGKSVGTKTEIWLEFPKGEKATVEQIFVSE